MESGLLNIPLLLGIIIYSVLTGGIVSAFGYYILYIYVTTIIIIATDSLLTTL